MSLSSDKRYVNKAERREALASKKRLDSAPKLDDKAMKLLEDLKERPFVTLQERCKYIEVMTGLSLSRSTMCRPVARIGPLGTTRRFAAEHPKRWGRHRGNVCGAGPIAKARWKGVGCPRTWTG